MLSYPPCYTRRMPLWIIFFIQLLVLYVLSRWLNGSLFSLFYRLTRSHRVAVSATTLILFPGTVAHELSHLFVAEILRVRTGRLTLFPKIRDDSYVEAGSVEVEKSDPIRRTLIGIAPLVVGIITITITSANLTSLFPQIRSLMQQTEIVKEPLFYVFIGLGYLLFAVSNNMFPSSVDMKGVPAVGIVVILFIATAYLVGVRFTLAGQALDTYVQILYSLVSNLTVVIVLNIVLLIIMRLLLFLLKR